jgi:hypothetical protein
MLKEDTLQSLFDARNVVSNAVIVLSPTNAAEKQQLAVLLKRRGSISAAINQVIEQTFNPSATGVDALVSNLEAEVDKLKALDQKLSNIGNIISAIDQVVQIAGSIVAAVV